MTTKDNIVSNVGKYLYHCWADQEDFTDLDAHFAKHPLGEITVTITKEMKEART